ncbi:MAG: Crp/Fnr family transcriptional regulator [Bacteroidales bacterium]|nr:Crp/Fnr family transcriptional regulator [Bacteroidales bacterium]
MTNGPINTCSAFNSKLSCFDFLTDQEKELVDRNQVEVVYKKGEIICKQGAFASNIIFLKEGLVKVYLEGQNKNLILKVTPSNNLIGLPVIYEGNNTFLYSVAAYVDSRISLIDITVFKQILSQNARFASQIINILNENTVLTYGRFFCLTHKQMHGRLADILLCLSQRIFKNKVFSLPLSRNDLAELTGMSAESVSRIIKEFKQDNLIEIIGKEFRILDFDRLLRISEKG